MICSNCSNPLQPDAHFCSRCGARMATPAPQPFPQATVPYPPYFPNRVARHVQTLGMLWMIYAIWYTLKRLLGLTIMHSFFGHHHEFPFNTFFIWPFAMGSVLLTLGLSLIAAYGLMNRQPWGRVMAVISAVFALVHPVLGTALGIYTLWVLAPAVSGLEYAAMATPVVAQGQQQPPVTL